MKKFLAVAAVALVTIAALAGCAPQAIHNDGTFIAVSDANDRGFVRAEVTIARDKITAVKLMEFNALGLEKGPTYGYAPFHTFLAEMPKRFVEKNNWDVDVVSQATSSSNGAKQAVLRATQMARKTKTTAATMWDGTFMAISDRTERGWGIAWVTINGGKISRVVLHETRPAPERDAAGAVVLGPDGRPVTRRDAAGNVVFERKPADYAFAPYHEAIVELPKRFVAKNSAQVDAFTGATGTSTNSMLAVQRALDSAKR
ncbi:MAG: Electron transport complex subunit RsxG [Firmicutes bacterium]|nr:Electron transport complex subunit RsxG [candidate division NPL-UPA2 bacterium]